MLYAQIKRKQDLETTFMLEKKEPSQEQYNTDPYKPQNIVNSVDIMFIQMSIHIKSKFKKFEMYE